MVRRRTHYDSRIGLEGSLCDVSARTLLDRCGQRRVTGLLRVTSWECVGTIELRGGRVERAIFGNRRGDSAIAEMLTLRDGSYELRQSLPDLGHRSSRTARLSLRRSMQQCVDRELSCRITCTRDRERAEFVYRGGALVDIRLNGAPYQGTPTALTHFENSTIQVAPLPFSLDGSDSENTTSPAWSQVSTQRLQSWSDPDINTGTDKRTAPVPAQSAMQSAIPLSRPPGQPMAQPTGHSTAASFLGQSTAQLQGQPGSQSQGFSFDRPLGHFLDQPLAQPGNRPVAPMVHYQSQAQPLGQPVLEQPVGQPGHQPGVHQHPPPFAPGVADASLSPQAAAQPPLPMAARSTTQSVEGAVPTANNPSLPSWGTGPPPTASIKNPMSMLHSYSIMRHRDFALNTLLAVCILSLVIVVGFVATQF